MKVIVNTQEIEISESATLHQALKRFEAQPPFAVMVNGDFIPKSQYETHQLKENDQVEVLAAIQGG